MGCQVGFYLSDDDEREFSRHGGLSDVIFLSAGITAEPVADICTLSDGVGGDGVERQLRICRRSDNRLVVWSSLDDSRYYIDVLRSPTIEYIRSYYDAPRHSLISGRLWYEHKYWDKDEQGCDVLREKSPELKKLYESLARWIRSHCKKLPNGNYIGQHAQKLLEAGARLSPP